MAKPFDISQQDLFSGDLLKSRLEFAAKTKNLEWLKSASLFFVNDEASLREQVARALAADTPKSVDTESTGLRIFEDKLVGVSVGWIDPATSQPTAFYVPLRSDIFKVNLDPHVTLSILAPIVKEPCVYMNFKHDYKFFKASGIAECQLLADLQLMDICRKDGVDEFDFRRFKETSLKKRFHEVFGLDLLELSDILGDKIYNFALASEEFCRIYGGADAWATIALYHKLKEDLLEDFIYQLETKLLPIVADMEFRGILIDAEMLKKAKSELRKENAGLEKTIYELAGETFKITSGPQLAKVLYTKLGLTPSKLTKGGAPSTDSDVLEKLQDKHPVIEHILKHKGNEKMINTFLGKMVTGIGPDGKVRTNLNSWGAISGRFSSSRPALQQLPKAKEKGESSSVIRKAFVPSPGYYFIDADYSQVEYRLFSSMCGDERLIKAFLSGADFHKQTASVMFNIPLEKVTDGERHKAKTLNFGLLYGMQAYSLSKNLKCTEEEAQKLLDAYFSKMPAVLPWVKAVKKRIQQEGFSTTLYGRKRLFPDAKLPMTKENMRAISSALREGLNHKIQGTSADLIKAGMIRLSNAFRAGNYDISMLLQVHDELVFEVSETIPIDVAVDVIREGMEVTPKGYVPIKAEFSVGYSWGDSVKYRPGMSLMEVPRRDVLTVSGDPEVIMSRGEELKKVLSGNPGTSGVFIKINDTCISAQTVDVETGEVIPYRVAQSKKLMDEIGSLGLTGIGVY